MRWLGAKQATNHYFIQGKWYHISLLGHSGLMKVKSGSVDFSDNNNCQEQFLIESSEL